MIFSVFYFGSPKGLFKSHFSFRYKTICGLLLAGEIKTFTGIFKWIPYSVVARDIGTSKPRMKKMVANPSLWTLGEIYRLAELIGYDKKKLLMMAAAEGR